MKFIQLSSFKNNAVVYVNIEQIGFIYDTEQYTKVSITSHNNGGLEVNQCADEIIDLINEAIQNNH